GSPFEDVLLVGRMFRGMLHATRMPLSSSNVHHTLVSPANRYFGPIDSYPHSWSTPYLNPLPQVVLTLKEDYHETDNSITYRSRNDGLRYRLYGPTNRSRLSRRDSGLHYPNSGRISRLETRLRGPRSGKPQRHSRHSGERSGDQRLSRRKAISGRVNHRATSVATCPVRREQQSLRPRTVFRSGGRRALVPPGHGERLKEVCRDRRLGLRPI